MHKHLVLTVLAALFTAACATAPSAPSAPAQKPAVTAGNASGSAAAPRATTASAAAAAVVATQTVQIKLEESDFRESGNVHQAREVKVPVGATVVLSMGSNPTTGYTWNENADIDNPNVLKLVRRQWTGPALPVPGAGGTEQWTLQALKPGEAVARWSYGRSWTPGEKAWTMMLIVKVQ
jgi:inhibitor of cysteine peptidase